jgi:hypothetical protein
MASLASISTQLTQVLKNQETIMGTQAQDDANLAAGIKTVIADEQTIKDGIAALSTRVSAALAGSAAASDPAVQQAIADLGTLHAAMNGDATALAAIAPSTAAPAPAPTDGSAPSGEVPIGG